MKKFISISVLVLFLALLSNNAFGYSKSDLDSANYLGYKGFIVYQQNEKDYNLDQKISRREMLKVMIMISGVPLANTCSGAFTDLTQNDWACKYGDTGLNQNFIQANKLFNPNDNISKIEALKMIMKATNIEKSSDNDWRVGYVSKALEAGIINETFSDYDTKADRAWIFTTAKNAYLSVDNEDLNLINFFLGK